MKKNAFQFNLICIIIFSFLNFQFEFVSSNQTKLDLSLKRINEIENELKMIRTNLKAEIIHKDTLIVVALANLPHINTNFDFFSYAGMPSQESRYFVLAVHNGEPDPIVKERLECLSKLSNFQYIIRENDIDMCAYRHVFMNPGVFSKMRAFKEFVRFIFFNGSVRGPFLRNFENVDTWPEIFLGVLSKDIALSGTTINARNGKVNELHLQSMLYGMDYRGVHVFLEMTSWCDNLNAIRDKKQHAINNVELKFTNRIIDLGYNIASLQKYWNGHDFRNRANTASKPKSADQAFIDAYFGITISLFEMVFIKTNRDISPKDLELHTQWISAQNKPKIEAFCLK